MPNPIPALQDAVGLAKALDNIDTVIEQLDAMLRELNVWVKLEQPMPTRGMMKLERQIHNARRYQKQLRALMFKVAR